MKESRRITIAVSVVVCVVVVGCVFVWLTYIFLFPKVTNKVVVSTNNERKTEGLFSRVSSWLGCAIFAEKNGAAGLVLQSKDESNQYSEDNADLCAKYLAKSEFELKPGGLQKEKVVMEHTMCHHIWKYPLLHLSNRGVLTRTCYGLAETQRILLKYTTFNDEHETAADEFWRANFDGLRVIGVHWRGTDNTIRWPHMSDDAQRFLEAVLREIPNHDAVFVASDEAGFVDLLKKSCNKKVVAQECTRSTDGVALHTNPLRSPLNVAKSVILDALVLSKCNHLIKGRSCVSDYSFLRNPEMSCDLLLTEKLKFRKKRGYDAKFRGTK